MLIPTNYVVRISLLGAIVVILAACAGKDDVSPVDAEKQAFDDLRTEVRATINDPERGTETIEIINTLEQDVARFREHVAQRRRHARALNSDYDVPRSEFEAFFAEVNNEIKESRARVTATHSRFLQVVKPDERKAIFKAHTRAMKAAIQSIQAI